MTTAALRERITVLANPAGVQLRPVDLAQAVSGARMKGFTLVHQLEAMQAGSGEAFVNEWLASLPDAFAEFRDRRSITSVGWLPFELYFSAVSHQVAHQFGGEVRAASEIGHANARRDIGAFFRRVLSFASPATVLQISGRFWRSYFDRSSLVVIESGPQSVTVEIRDWPLRDETSMYEMAGSLVAWTEATRVRDVRVSRLEVLRPGLFAVSVAWS